MNNETSTFAVDTSAAETTSVAADSTVAVDAVIENKDTTVAADAVETVVTIGAMESVTGTMTEVGVAETQEPSKAENMADAIQILGQGMASIFVVLGLIAVVVAALKKLDSKQK